MRVFRPRAAARAALAIACCLPWLAAASLAGEAADRTKLTVYTALEPEQHAVFKAAIEAAIPEVEIVWVWAQTGAITDRFLAERDHPQADMILGLAATSLITFKAQGLLASYKPADSERLRDKFVDPASPYSWTGMDAYLGVLCFNGDRAAAARISAPVSWRDLLAPNLKGHVAMPDPRLTGTGYLLVAGWLQSMGEAEGWAFMDALHDNVAAYLPTGAGPCVGTAKGNYVVGMTYDMRGALLKADGAPIRLIVPIDGVGWEEEAFAIVKGSPHEDLARRVADWAASPAANRIYSETFAIVAHPEVSNYPANYPPYAEARMIRNDLAWMSANRPRILAEWARRYASKAVPVDDAFPPKP